MEKSYKNYPQMPSEMNPVGQSSSYSGHTTMAAPPTYEQATIPGYPPVQVLPTSTVPPPNTQVYVGSQANPSYVGVTVGSNMVPPQTTYTRQHQGMPPQPMVQQPVVIIQQQGLTPLGPEPTYVVCPYCHIQKLTRINHDPSSKTHLMAALLCILGLWCCVCLPYCAESCMNTNHYCGNCNRFLGTYTDSL